jgi:hypothetical protein
VFGKLRAKVRDQLLLTAQRRICLRQDRCAECQRRTEPDDTESTLDHHTVCGKDKGANDSVGFVTSAVTAVTAAQRSINLDSPMPKSRFKPDRKPPLRLAAGLPWLLLAGLIGITWYWLGPKFGVEDYPSAWPAPKLFLGDRGGCPDLSGTYDDVDDVVPRLLQGGPAWVQGGRGWFEHKATLTQPKDGSTLTIHMALNEKGLPEHREHELLYNQGWPSGGTLTLKRGTEFECRGRWLYVGSDRYISKDRAGNLIIAHDTTMDGRSSFYGLTWGSESVPVTRWYRWPRRLPGNDLLLKSAYSFEINRYDWTNNNGTEVVVKLSNYMGERQCVRVWDPSAPNPRDKSANATIAAGVVDDSGLCPAPWRILGYPGSTNFSLEVKKSYQVAHYPASTPTAAPTVTEIYRPLEVALMPDQDEVRRQRRLAETTPEQRAAAAAQERERKAARAREAAERERLERIEQQKNVPKMASREEIQQRLQALLTAGKITKVTLAPGHITISGEAPNNVDVANFLRTIDRTDPAAKPELLVIEGDRTVARFELTIQASALTDPS